VLLICDNEFQLHSAHAWMKMKLQHFKFKVFYKYLGELNLLKKKTTYPFTIAVINYGRSIDKTRYLNNKNQMPKVTSHIACSLLPSGGESVGHQGACDPADPCA